jgi:hypothetical protein
MVCLNGCVVSEEQFGTIRIRHMGFEPQQIIDATSQFSASIPQIMGRVREYKQIELNPSEREVFAESALIMKVNDEDEKVERSLVNLNIGNRIFDIPRLLTYTRKEDAAPTLWNTYNIIQEKFTKGNRFERDNDTLQPKKVRGIKSIDETVRVNKGLWHLMSKMAELKGATA